MPGKITLQIVAGPLNGRRFEFDEHDVLLVGRDPKCHVVLPQDGFVSRHHFMLEFNPPLVSLRDLGSLNGTFINGVRYGGRGTDAPSANPAPPVALVDGDRIQIGQTVMVIAVERLEAAATLLTCVLCGRTVSTAEEALDGADYLCDSCGQNAARDPGDFLKTMVTRDATVKGRGLAGSLAEYKVKDRLGMGGMGAVFLAEARSDGAKVVLKVLHSKLAANKQNRERFMREMLVMRSLAHPNIVRYRDFGSIGGTFFFIVEFCDSGTLASFMAQQRDRIPWQTALPHFRQILQGLAFAHQREVVHRDLKPDNILLHQGPGGLIARIGDFGLAKIHSLAGLRQLTVTDEFVGTFPYMAREQLLSCKYVTPVSDVWSTAAMFYYVLTKQFPRDMPYGRDPVDVIMEDAIRPIEHWGLDIPPRLAAVINRGLASDEERRWPSAAEFLAALEKAV